MGRLFDSKIALRLVLAALILLIMGAAGVLLSVSGLHSGSEAAAKTSSSATSTQNTKVDASEENAKLLYDCRVEDVNDTAAVVSLLETMKLEDVAGRYEATIRADGDTQAMTIALQEPVQKSSKKSLDRNMENCAQQIMALMPAVGRVEWTYSLDSSKEEEETATVSLDEAAATKQLSKDVKKYGKSEKAFRKLLVKQADTASSAKNK